MKAVPRIVPILDEIEYTSLDDVLGCSPYDVNLESLSLQQEDIYIKPKGYYGVHCE